MHDTPAALVRTLAAGHHPAQVHIAWSETVWTVVSTLDPAGHPLLLIPDGTGLDTALRNSGDSDTAVALHFDDEAPLPNAPWLGSAWIAGWAEPLPASQQREAAMAFADTHPIPELLDIGDGWTLWRVNVAEIRLETEQRVVEVCPHDYAAADADPMYPLEVELLLDLYDHHPEVLEALRHRIAHEMPQVERITPLRMNRHGILIDVHRADEAKPRRCLIRHRHTITDLGQVLHSLCRCDCPGGAMTADNH